MAGVEHEQEAAGVGHFDDAEFKHWNDVICAFEEYGLWMDMEVARRHRHLEAVPPALLELLCVAAVSCRVAVADT